MFSVTSSFAHILKLIIQNRFHLLSKFIAKSTCRLPKRSQNNQALWSLMANQWNCPETKNASWRQTTVWRHGGHHRFAARQDPRIARATRLPRFALNKWINSGFWAVYFLVAVLWKSNKQKPVNFGDWPTDHLIQVPNYYCLLQVLLIYQSRLQCSSPRGVLQIWIEVTGMIRWGEKSAKQIPRALNETPKNPWTKI